MKAVGWTLASCACISGSCLLAADAEWLIIGNDTKIECRSEGLTKVEPGEDSVTFINLADGTDRPEMIHLPMSNSIFGPPTNLAVTPDQSLAIVANSVSWKKEGDEWLAVPATELHLIDLKGELPKRIGGVETKAQPSGLAISRDGKRMLVANRADQSVSLFCIEGSEVALVDTVAVEGQAAAVAFHPDGKSALVTEFSEHQVARIRIEDDSLDYDPLVDIPVGLWPYNVKIHPGGEFAIVCNTGNSGLPDGQRDTLSLIDLKGQEPHVYDTVSVGDGPEGLAISADGNYVAVPLLNGSTDVFKGKWFHHPHGEVVLYKVEGRSLVELDRVETGAFPEGVAFSKDGTRLYVANLDSEDLSVFAVGEEGLELLGDPLKLPGKPGSMGSGQP